jgi:hypothetical protein
MFITLAEDYSTIKHTGEPMSEKEVRAQLADAGMPEPVIRARIESARKHPLMKLNSPFGAQSNRGRMTG